MSERIDSHQIVDSIRDALHRAIKEGRVTTQVVAKDDQNAASFRNAMAERYGIDVTEPKVAETLLALMHWQNHVVSSVLDQFRGHSQEHVNREIVEALASTSAAVTWSCMNTIERSQEGE